MKQKKTVIAILGIVVVIIIAACILLLKGSKEQYTDLGNNMYQTADKIILIAGMDGIPGTEDDNLLSGRTTEMGGAISIANVDVDTVTYTIEGASDAYTVSAGVDKKLGTYDDVIKASDGSLGTYYIKKADEKEAVGWIYLGGDVTDMFILSEYVLDNVLFDDNNYRYSDDKCGVRAELKEMQQEMGITAALTDKTLSMATPSADHVIVEVDEGEVYVELGEGKYYTDLLEQEDVILSEQEYLFLPSINEMTSAFGDTSDKTESQYKRAQGAPAYLATNLVANKKYTDGNGEMIQTSAYWLRSPGYTSTGTDRASSIDSDGMVCTVTTVATVINGVRPACYVNLSTK